ncbi:MAG: phosphatase PAP2 family protein [Bacteroidales bacterium]
MKHQSFSDKLKNLPGGIFLLGSILVLPGLLIIVLIYTRMETHMAINSFHTSFLDNLMKYWTHLGDGLMQIIVVSGLLFISIRYFFTGLTAFLSVGLAAQFFKRLVFIDFPRPVKFFEIHNPGYQLYLVPDVDVLTWLSFPSGHAATAFGLFFSMALLTKSRALQAGLFIIAAGVGYSRVYLSHHFLMDVVAGAFLGMILGWLSWRIFSRYARPWIECSILNVLKP